MAEPGFRGTIESWAEPCSILTREQILFLEELKGRDSLGYRAGLQSTGLLRSLFPDVPDYRFVYHASALSWEQETSMLPEGTFLVPTYDRTTRSLVDRDDAALALYHTPPIECVGCIPRQGAGNPLSYTIEAHGGMPYEWNTPLLQRGCEWTRRMLYRGMCWATTASGSGTLCPSAMTRASQ